MNVLGSKQKPAQATKIISVILLLAISACTKERPYVKEARDGTSEYAEIDKGLLDTKSEYLYVPSSLNSTRTTDATFPMYMGDAKVVRLQLSETELRVLEVDSEKKFSGGPVNDKPVLSIPIKHVDYRCAKDLDGKCTNREEEDQEKPWADRRFIEVQGKALAVQEINFLPVQIKNLFYPCHEETGSHFSGLKVDSNAINLSLEKTYKTGLSCGPDINSLSDLTFRVVYTYSLAKLNSVTDSNYKPLTYSKSEKNTFGFFETQTLKLDVDGNDNAVGEKEFVNRWNPNKTVIYELSPNFEKPENAKIKLATIDAVNSINKTLLKSGTELQIKLQLAAPDSNPGDIRKNTIVMVEEPVNYGILGYGPTAANPRTGQIVHGRTAMYLGVIKTGISRAYDEIIKEKTIAKEIVKNPIELSPELLKSQIPDMKMTISDYKQIRSVVDKSISDNTALPVKSKTPAAGQVLSAKKSLNKKIDIDHPVNLSKLRHAATHHHERRLSIKNIQMMLNEESKDSLEAQSIRDQVMSTHCFFSIDDLNVKNSIEEEVERVITEVGLKPWAQLSEEEKVKVIDVLIPFVWVPTLVHELGHNLGLRHNFAGSEDKPNFYSKEELAEMGMKRDFAYSSVMDYGYRATNELQIMGKYDVAALRFGYAEQIELQNGKLQSLADYRKSPGEANNPPKDFKYCTDEHVDVNPNCNRFDEGTNLVEMTKHFIQMHEDMYSKRNFRNELRNFSLYDEPKYISRVQNIMFNLRTTFERYEDIQKSFEQLYGLTHDSPYWETDPFLKDLKESSRIAGRYFLEVLKTPDVLCAVATKDKPNLIVGLEPIRRFSPRAISCYDPEIAQILEKHLVVGQAGKTFQSRKDPRSENFYMDQIDVRGIWMDKLLAAKQLVGRKTGIESYDEFTGNFLDLPDMREEIQATLSDIVLDKVIANVPIQTVTGQVIVAELPVKFFDHKEGQNAHLIQKPLHPGVRQLFRLPNDHVDFQAHVIEMLARELPSRDQKAEPSSMLNSIAALVSIENGLPENNYFGVNLGLRTLFVHQLSAVSGEAAISLEIVRLLNGIDRKKLIEILQLVAEEKPLPEGSTVQEKMAYSLGLEILLRYLQEGFQEPVFYETMLSKMAGI